MQEDLSHLEPKRCPCCEVVRPPADYLLVQPHKKRGNLKWYLSSYCWGCLCSIDKAPLYTLKRGGWPLEKVREVSEQRLLNRRLNIKGSPLQRDISTEAYKVGAEPGSIRVPLPPLPEPPPPPPPPPPARAGSAERLEVFGRLVNGAKQKREHSDRRGPPPSKAGFVYLLSDGTAVKIGQSKDMKARKSTLQTGNSNPIVPLCVVQADNAYQLEKTLHALFTKSRKDGEWFQPVPEILEWFRSKSAEQLAMGKAGLPFEDDERLIEYEIRRRVITELMKSPTGRKIWARAEAEVRQVSVL